MHHFPSERAEVKAEPSGSDPGGTNVTLTSDPGQSSIPSCGCIQVLIITRAKVATSMKLDFLTLISLA